MNISFITGPPPRRLAASLLALAAVLGCARSTEPLRVPSASPTPVAVAGAADVIGALKLVRQEYANAVPPAGGTVTDATEYAETDLFAEQAESKFAAFVRFVDETRAAAIRDGLARVRSALARKAPTAEVAREVDRTVVLVEELLAGTVPEEIRGPVLATTRADQAIAAEEVVGEYRVGVVTGPARPIYVRRDGASALLAQQPGQVYLGVLLRERRTKRFLPASTVTAVLSRDGQDTAVVLGELWGDFHQYGADVTLPGDGPLGVTIHASAPAYARHGDMLTHFVRPVDRHDRGRGTAGDAALRRPSDRADGRRLCGRRRRPAGTQRGRVPARGGAVSRRPDRRGARAHLDVAGRARPSSSPSPPTRPTTSRSCWSIARPDSWCPTRASPCGSSTTGASSGPRSLHPLLSVFSHYGETLRVARRRDDRPHPRRSAGARVASTDRVWTAPPISTFRSRRAARRRGTPGVGDDDRTSGRRRRVGRARPRRRRRGAVARRRRFRRDDPGRRHALSRRVGAARGRRRLPALRELAARRRGQGGRSGALPRPRGAMARARRRDEERRARRRGAGAGRGPGGDRSTPSRGRRSAGARRASSWTPS